MVSPSSTPLTSSPLSLPTGSTPFLSLIRKQMGFCRTIIKYNKIKYSKIKSHYTELNKTKTIRMKRAQENIRESETHLFTHAGISEKH